MENLLLNTCSRESTSLHAGLQFLYQFRLLPYITSTQLGNLTWMDRTWDSCRLSPVLPVKDRLPQPFLGVLSAVLWSYPAPWQSFCNKCPGGIRITHCELWSSNTVSTYMTFSIRWCSTYLFYRICGVQYLLVLQNMWSAVLIDNGDCSSAVVDFNTYLIITEETCSTYQIYSRTGV